MLVTKAMVRPLSGHCHPPTTILKHNTKSNSNKGVGSSSLASGFLGYYNGSIRIL